MGLNRRLNSSEKEMNELAVRTLDTKLKYREQKHMCICIYMGQGDQTQ